MRLLDVICAPWAIMPDRYTQILEIYNAHVRGPKIDLEAVSRQLGRPMDNQPRPYDTRDGVAVLPVVGPVAKRMGSLNQISGGTSSAFVLDQFQQALKDPTVRAIVLHVDSPGGSVDGTRELAQTIFDARGQKPVVAFADGLMASAAYWIAAAADQVLMAGETTRVGSIGVVATHTDMSRAEEKAGVKTTEITAGKYKCITSQYAPLTEEGRTVLQDHVDAIYSLFVNDIAAFRGVSSEIVLEKMADGRVFMGTKAVEAGLVDGVATLQGLIAQLSHETQTGGWTPPAAAGAAVPPQPSIQGDPMEMTKENLLAHAPLLAEELRAEGAAAERARIQAVEEQGMPGHEALVQSLKFDGRTSGPEAAAQVLAAHKKHLAKTAQDLASDAPPPVAPSTLAPSEPKPVTAQELAAKATAYQAEQAAKGITISIAEAVVHVQKEA